MWSTFDRTYNPEDSMNYVTYSMNDFSLPNIDPTVRKITYLQVENVGFSLYTNLFPREVMCFQTLNIDLGVGMTHIAQHCSIL